MNNENTASQPKAASIADDARLEQLFQTYYKSQTVDEMTKLKAAIISHIVRAPADQAASVKPCGWLAGNTGDDGEYMHWRREDAQAECDAHNAYESEHYEPERQNIRQPEPVYAAPQQLLAPAADLRDTLVELANVQRKLIDANAIIAYYQIAAEGQVSAAAPADERAKFEAWCEHEDSPYYVADLDRHEDGYVKVSTNMAWAAWQARASEGQAQTSAAIAPPDVHANPTPEMQRAREAMEAAKAEAEKRPYGTPGWKRYERAYGDAILAYGAAVASRDWRLPDAAQSADKPTGGDHE